MADQTVMIKRVDDDGHDDHHGGGWKVAYADFMTAMMAFFLLLWILAASDEEKLRGLADYFTPSLSEAGGRGQGMFAGQVLAEDGVLSGTDGPKSEVQLPSFGQENPLAVFDSRIRYDERYASAALPEPGGTENEEAGISEADADTDKLNPGTGAFEFEQGRDVEAALSEDAMDGIEETLADLIAAEEARVTELEAVQEQIEAALLSDPELAALYDNLTFEITEDGLKIQMVDSGGQSMFEIGSARITGRTEGLIRTVARSVADTAWPVSISGHTDSLPYAEGASYTNWELSADRANATRRVLVSEGVLENRIVGVTAFADTNPLTPAQADAPENRRIGILLQYPSQLPGALREFEAKLGPQ